MKPQTSKGSLNHERSCRFLISAFLLQSGSVIAALLQLFARILPEGAAMPDFQGMLRALALENSMKMLADSDDAVFAANARLARARLRRNEAVRRVAQELSRLRGTLLNQFRPSHGRIRRRPARSRPPDQPA